MAEQTTRTLVVVNGGLSEESSSARLAEGLVRATREQAAGAGITLAVEQIDVRSLAHDIAGGSLSGFVGGTLAQAYETLARADAVIAVTPVYKASYTGLFKGFWDVTPDGLLSGVPVLVGATGGSPRHSLVVDTAMRPLFAYLKAPTMPTGVFAAAEDWAEPSLGHRMTEAAAELVGHLGSGSRATAAPADHAERTLQGTRDRARDPFTDVPTMADLLGR